MCWNAWFSQFICSEISLLGSIHTFRRYCEFCSTVNLLTTMLFCLIAAWEPLICLIPDEKSSENTSQIAYLLLSIRVQLKKMATEVSPTIHFFYFFDFQVNSSLTCVTLFVCLFVCCQAVGLRNWHTIPHSSDEAPHSESSTPNVQGLSKPETAELSFWTHRQAATTICGCLALGHSLFSGAPHQPCRVLQRPECSNL